jgi:histidinol-phosphate aminotransferase
MRSLMRPDLMDVNPYVSAYVLSGGVVSPVRLDANENPWAPFGPVGEVCLANRYAASEEAALYTRVAEFLGVTVEEIILGRGSSEAIDLLLRLFCRAGQDEILICPPTFSMYAVNAKVQGAKVLSVPLMENGQLNLPEIEKTCTDNTKLIFIPTPNAPMGHAMNRADMLKLCQMRAGKSVIVADEAYVELSDTPEGLMAETKTYPNLIILRTFSKAHGLAGERLGLAYGNPEIIEMLKRISAPYSIAQSSIRAALDALSPAGLALYRDRVAMLKSECKRLLRLLPQSSMVVRVFDSCTNFLLVQTKNVQETEKGLLKNGVRVRTKVCTIPETLRLSIGTPDENDAVLAALGVSDPDKKKE